jgi:hypothetical protein
MLILVKSGSCTQRVRTVYLRALNGVSTNSSMSCCSAWVEQYLSPILFLAHHLSFSSPSSIIPHFTICLQYRSIASVAFRWSSSHILGLVPRTASLVQFLLSSAYSRNVLRTSGNQNDSWKPSRVWKTSRKPFLRDFLEFWTFLQIIFSNTCLHFKNKSFRYSGIENFFCLNFKKVSQYCPWKKILF